jgi:AGZA family xanthine/uracil permease-like MFS transporter
MLNRFFNIEANGSNVRREILAGITTFLTMAYIVFVQPAVLTTDFAGNPTGMDFGAVLTATCIMAAAASIFMGIYANYPIALAPGMGENFFFVSVIMTLSAQGVNEAWRTALGIVFISGLIFLFLSVIKVRESLINAMSRSMRNGIAVGIGLFIAFIGLQHGGLIIAKPGSMVGLNTAVMSPDIIVFTIALLVTGALRTRKIRGDILWGIFAGAVTALILGKIKFSGVIGFPQINNSLLLKLDIAGALQLICLPFIIVFVFMDLFDTIGTLMGVAETADIIKDGKLPRAERVLIVDAASTVGGALAGTSTITSYIESVTGIAEGGRTGLTSIVTGLLFLAALIFSPLIGMIGQYPPITAAALVVVGTMMMRNIVKIDWDDSSESIPAFLVILGIPLSYSIADGLALGFISYPLIKFLGGRGKEVSWLMYFMALILVLYFIYVRH